MTKKDSIEKFIMSVINTICKILPLKKQIIFESIPELSGNAYFLYKKMIEHNYNKKYNIIWIIYNENSYKNLPQNVYATRISGTIKERIKTQWEIGRSKYIIDSNGYVYKKNKKQIRIHLKHGLPLKDASFYNKDIGETDLLCVPSDYWVNECAKEHGISPELIKPLGFPRNDMLVPEKHNGINIIWMPTYVSSHSVTSQGRKSLIQKMPFGLPSIENENQLYELNELFNKCGARLYIRLHPVQDDSVASIKEMSNLILCDDKFLNRNNTTLYSFLCKTDALVSDYSSVYYDYLKLDKPIALVTKFFKEYKEECESLKYTYDEYVEKFPAVFVNSYEELLDFFKAVINGEDPDSENRKEIKKKYMPESNSDSSENIINYMKENFGF